MIVSKLVCYKKCVTALARLDSDMMSVLGLPGRPGGPPRDQLSLCGVAITGEPGAASQAYRHDYNLLLPQIVSPVALLGLPLAISRLTSHLFTTTTYLEKSSQSHQFQNRFSSEEV